MDNLETANDGNKAEGNTFDGVVYGLDSVDLSKITEAHDNTAVGYNAMEVEAEGIDNIAIGKWAAGNFTQEEWDREMERSNKEFLERVEKERNNVPASQPPASQPPASQPPASQPPASFWKRLYQRMKGQAR